MIDQKLTAIEQIQQRYAEIKENESSEFVEKLASLAEMITKGTKAEKFSIENKMVLLCASIAEGPAMVSYIMPMVNLSFESITELLKMVGEDIQSQLIEKPKESSKFEASGESNK